MAVWQLNTPAMFRLFIVILLALICFSQVFGSGKFRVKEKDEYCNMKEGAIKKRPHIVFILADDAVCKLTLLLLSHVMKS